MIFSYKKLKTLANINVEVNEVVKALNNIGFEVEGYTKFSQVSGIKFGHVQKIYKNPNADRLNVCEIKFADQDRIIQTTATNVKVGDYLVAFVPGAKSGDITFAAKELQGIVSEGMLASLTEMGFFKDSLPEEFVEGIYTFEAVDLNLDPMEYFDLDDYLIDVSVLSNRSDANSYLIMSRELAAYFNTKWNDLEFFQGNLKSDFAAANKEGILTLIEATNELKPISIQEQFLLMKSNIKLIDPVVDLTNLTLIMTGMPVHAYDKAKLASNLLYAADYSGNFTILGNKTLDLNNALAIVNSKKIPVSLAGVMGGEFTKITETTENVVFELGIFPVKKVRHTVKEIKMESNSSKQSSKQISLGTLLLGHKFLSSYLINFSPAINLPKIENKLIDFDLNFVNQIAGSKITTTPQFVKTQKSLEILGFKFLEQQIEVPAYRHDVNSKEDVIEEIFRFYSYANFAPAKPVQNSLEDIYAYYDFHQAIAAMGYQQVWTYSLISTEKNFFNPFDFQKDIVLKTFVSKEREVIRNSFLISLAEVIDYNQKRKIEDISIFDIGMVNEIDRVIALASTTKNFQQMQNDLQALYQNKLQFKRTNSEFYHNGVSAHIYYNEQLVGWIGKPHPKYNLPEAFYAEIIEPKRHNSTLKFQTYNSEPLKTRDLTVSLQSNQSIAEIIKSIQNKIQPYDIKVVDNFVKENTKNITLRIFLEDEKIAAFEKFAEKFI
ncbi:phenylalanine--tRNA ligase subunit beta [Candidatus Mycoplasma pogonae]